MGFGLVTTIRMTDTGACVSINRCDQGEERMSCTLQYVAITDGKFRLNHGFLPYKAIT